MDKRQPQLLTREYLKQEIRDAFSKVRLGGGIGLWEGQSIDDYESPEQQSKSRGKDQKADWTKLSEDDLNDCYSSLSFFDAEGMRFHLPAYMCLAIDGMDQTDSVVFQLTGIDEYRLKRFELLNSAQREAIAHFLQWYMRQEDHEPHRDEIQAAIDSYWIAPRELAR